MTARVIPFARPAPRLPPAPPASGPVATAREATLDRLDEVAARTLPPGEMAARVAELEAESDRAAARLAKARAHLAAIHGPASECPPLLSELRCWPVASGPLESA